MIACYYTDVMKYLDQRPERASGELTIKGTRIRVAQVINMLANGFTIEQLHEGWPWVSVATLRGAVEEATQLLSAHPHAETVL
jgi:uncharacterized protein (DUF433 family)